MGSYHIPVLQKEVLRYLDPKPNQNFIDATIGEGGHALAILERTSPNGKLLGIDWSPEIIENCKLKIKNVKKRTTLVCDNFANLKEVVKRERFLAVSGILLDLGMSSWHLTEAGRGFSFLKNEPLDMRYGSQNPLTAEKIVNYWSKSEIEENLREYGEERFAKKIAEKIIEIRKSKPIKTTFQLVEIIKKAVPSRYLHQKIHFATRTFQALRITVNDELNNLEKALPQTLEILKPGGRLAIISFHSLEDRIVKNFYRDSSPEKLKILTKKPIRPQKEEIKINPRSRSAKLRAAQKSKRTSLSSSPSFL
ncbi:MAG: 16S rRNA (cytosine(1402)-N(4))-methyltransferase RsmH [Candidatus Nealsonbacteria bacterium]|nr:MAG: 16S rRNA (cytosine(1402)-N(4))-methyltransferase RsmH [Candidatus Nealsonbacteria bacterium]